MDARRSDARPPVPSWDEIMRRQRRGAAFSHALPTDGVMAPGGTLGERWGRPTLAAIHLDQAGGRARVTVELAHGGSQVGASAERSSLAAAAADATAEALNELAGPTARCEVTSVDAGGDRIVVELTVATAHGSQRLVGAVPVDQRGPGGAAVCATLDAVNRSFGRWLAV